MADIVKEVVGTSFALTVMLADGQQITFQSGFAEDETDAQIDVRLDRLMRISGRQRALAEMPKLKEERDELLTTQVQRRSDEKEADAKWEDEIASIQERQQKAFDEGYDEHVKGGKQSAYQPKGNRATVISGCIREIERMKADRDQHLQQRVVYHERVDMRVKALEEKIADAEKLGAT